MVKGFNISANLFVAVAHTLCVVAAASAQQSAYAIRQIADESVINRRPEISETGLIAWQSFRTTTDTSAGTDIFVHRNGETFNLTEGVVERYAGNHDPQLYRDEIVWGTTIVTKGGEHTWIMVDPDDGDQTAAAQENQQTVRKEPSGDNELMRWNGNEITRLTLDNRDDLAPSFWGDTVAWQKARGWPFGWEIMVLAEGERMQLTTNFFYDMAPRVHNNQVVWYGWDGTNYEIFLYDHAQREITKITATNYDDVSPRIWDGVIVWEAFPSLHADIFMWRNGEIIKLSDNAEDDINPSLWNGQVVWQGFDGDFFQIFHYDGTNTAQLTNTLYDNINPHIRDGVIAWMGYVDNMDAEILAWTGGPDPIRLTDNEYEDQNPRTAGGRIVWQADLEGRSHIYIAEPR